jgi:hypothetical protein
MTANRRKSKGRSGHDSFVGFPRALSNHANFIRLSAHAHKLLFDIYQQYWGKNNGDLCAAWTLMKARGWRSKGTLNRALHELKHYGLITITRQGGRNMPSLYAVTWQPINECLDKHREPKIEVPSTIVASGIWKELKPEFSKDSFSLPPMCTKLPPYGVNEQVM